MHRAFKALSSSLLAVVVAVLAAAGCHSGECSSGSSCVCSGGHECYLGCDGDGCQQQCSGMDHCGTVCGNACASSCHDASECSQSCGADCVLTCASTPTCGIICGPNCNVDCRNASLCGVQVGPGSIVNCDSIGQCVVDCSGPCSVMHGSNTTINCAGGAAAVDCGGGRSVCGAC